ncbi:MAG: hypothetical protein WCP16_06795 [Pseudanabaena sp. ELA645]|jgi:uncharacterized integral membrane protein
MTRSRFSQPVNSGKNSGRNSTGAFPILQLLILGVSITILAAIFIQNLQPAVEIVFFGQKTLPIPLSVAMLIALVGGGLLAFGFNAIATWQQNLLIRRALVAAGTDNKSPNPENIPNKSSDKTPNNVSAYDDEEEDEIDDWEEDWDDEEDEELDEDPDTVPYGDRAKMKSANTKSASTRQVRDQRPPLDAKYIR